MNFFSKVFIFISSQVVHFKLLLYFLSFTNSSSRPPSLFHKEGGVHYSRFSNNRNYKLNI
jgi:hypothetical protein